MTNFADLIKSAGPAGDFEPLPNGKYEAEISSSEAAKTSNGKDMYKVTWTILAGPFKNRKVWSNMVISPESPAALGILFRQFAALGLGEDFFQTNPTLDQVANAMAGRKAVLTLTQNEWNGQMRNDVKGMSKYLGANGGLPASGGSSGPMGLPPAPSVPASTAPAATATAPPASPF